MGFLFKLSNGRNVLILGLSIDEAIKELLEEHYLRAFDEGCEIIPVTDFADCRSSKKS